ncbi:signal transduction histidine kinase [Paenibacillus phyllosphaerae]|uniref:histidine kinase n=1 Tax=Paenibacillus phyllosphaerae TaxID=274593 RepID=A0A7W5AUM3_9BACL|nr:HAMP domain-containing sensor histidine kinase [Paenibacillus phyllosphaerae]MBB3108471.1 signal transduction histidine kinase [Paenibacillus phyllosphaerae]
MSGQKAVSGAAKARKRRRPYISLRWRFLAALAALLVLTIAVLSTLVLRDIERNQRQRVESILKQRSELANLRISQTYLGDPQVDAQTFLRRSGPQLAADVSNLLSGTHVVIYNADGIEVGNSQPLSRTGNVADTLAIANQGKTVYQEADSQLIYMSPLVWTIGQVGVVQFEYSLAGDQQFYHTIALSIRTIGLIALAASFLLGLIYVQRVVHAIRKLQQATEQIRSGEYIVEPPVKRSDELGDLSEGITYMSLAIKQSMDRQKQFIGSISHEFKTPLTSIIAYTDLLDMYRDDPELLEEARCNMRREADRLLEMVEKVLRLSALEQYEFNQNAEPVELASLLAECCSRMSGKATKFELSLTTKLAEVTVMADRESLVHLFLNLLDNAIKYNVQGGEIVVSSTAEGGYAVISVRDTGIGIPEEAMDKLFQPFYTVSKDRARSTGGTGLGLSLVKQLAELQQGKIAVKSAIGAGSEFTVTLPLAPEAPKRLQRGNKSETKAT